MHRITRYPLLFKRLLSNLHINSSEHEALSKLINRIESLIGAINDAVKRSESAYRIRLIDQHLDFGVVADVNFHFW